MTMSWFLPVIFLLNSKNFLHKVDHKMSFLIHILLYSLLSCCILFLVIYIFLKRIHKAFSSTLINIISGSTAKRISQGSLIVIWIIHLSIHGLEWIFKSRNYIFHLRVAFLNLRLFPFQSCISFLNLIGSMN